MGEREAQVIPLPRQQEPPTDGSLALKSITETKRSRLRLIGPNPADDVAQVNRLQRVWDRTLGTHSSADGKFLNYNPVLARWKFEQLQTEEEHELFRENERQNVTTALRERNNTSESRLTLTIGDDRKIRNELLPDEAFDTVLERGYEYRKAHGSKELERERAEVEGFQKIQKKLTDPDAIVGTTFVVISSPSKVEDSQYVHNFVDMYTLAEDKGGKRHIAYVRYTSPLDTEAYERIAMQVKPDYFNGEKGPKDAWFLGHPLQFSDTKMSPDQIFERVFARDIQAMAEAQFQELYRIYLPFIQHYLDQLTASNFDPKKIAVAYNAILNSTEIHSMREQIQETTVFVAGQDQYNMQDIATMADCYGRQTVKNVDAGCGTSGGFSISNIGGQGAFANSVAGFGGGERRDNYGSLTFECPHCHARNKRQPGELISNCQNPNCGKDVRC